MFAITTKTFSKLVSHEFVNYLQNAGQGESVEVANCMDKIKGLQALMQKLIEAHRQEHINFVAMLEKQPSV